MSLDKNGRQILAILVERLPSVTAGRPATYVTYKQVHDRLGLRLIGPTYGESLKKQGLQSLAYWTAAAGYPAVTGLIIDGGSMMPGKGYFELFHRSQDDFDWWTEEVRRSKEFDWSQYLADFEPPPAPLAVDFNEPTERQSITVHRIIRDTLVSRRVKALHDYKCQICGHTITLPNGKKYAEAHHIRPLGSPHGGPDVVENVLCVCPNHHAELDFGIRSLSGDELSLVPDHRPADLHIRYHNEIVREKKRAE